MMSFILKDSSRLHDGTNTNWNDYRICTRTLYSNRSAFVAKIDNKDELTKRTIQIIGFGAALVLFIIKIVFFTLSFEGDIIPWPVIFGFVALGASGSYDIPWSRK